MARSPHIVGSSDNVMTVRKRVVVGIGNPGPWIPIPDDAFFRAVHWLVCYGGDGSVGQLRGLQRERDMFEERQGGTKTRRTFVIGTLRRIVFMHHYDQPL